MSIRHRALLLFVVTLALSLASASSGVGQDYDTSRRWSKNDSRGCVQLTQLEPLWVTATEENCEKRNEYGSCRDMQIRARITNTCDKRVDVRWRFPNSKYPAWNMRTLSPGSDMIAKCDKRADRCDGTIEWASRYSD